MTPSLVLPQWPKHPGIPRTKVVTITQQTGTRVEDGVGSTVIRGRQIGVGTGTGIGIDTGVGIGIEIATETEIETEIERGTGTEDAGSARTTVGNLLATGTEGTRMRSRGTHEMATTTQAVATHTMNRSATTTIADDITRTGIDTTTHMHDRGMAVHIGLHEIEVGHSFPPRSPEH